MDDRKDTLKELLLTLKPHELYEVGCKFKFDPADMDDEKFANNLATHIIGNISIMFKLYSKQEIEFAKKIVNTKNFEEDADIDCNVLVCDGLLGMKKKNGCEVFYATKDFVMAFKKEIGNNESESIINRYDRFDKIVLGIIRTYGIINIEDMYNIYIELNEPEISYDDFEDLIFFRTEILKNSDLFTYDGDEYIYIEEIDEPEDTIKVIINSDLKYNILTSEEYIENAYKEYICDENALNSLMTTLETYLSKEDKKYKDLIDTLVYDVKIDNYKDLMLDVATYICIATNEEDVTITKATDELFKTTGKWTKKGNI